MSFDTKLPLPPGEGGGEGISGFSGKYSLILSFSRREKGFFTGLLGVSFHFVWSSKETLRVMA